MSVRLARWLVRGVLSAALLASASAVQAQQNARDKETVEEQEPPTAPSTVDPRAEAALKRMSHDLSGLHSFRVVTESSTEVVLKSGEKVSYDATSRVAVKRPNMIRSDRVGDRTDISAYYDGKSLTLYGHLANMYATSPTPNTIDKAIDFAREKLNLDVPAADLMGNDPYAALMEDVDSGTYLGESSVDGVLCDHVAFRGHDVDFQLWIEKGKARALPRKYTITSKTVTGSPEFTVELHDWQVNPTLPASLFTFRPQPGATRVDFFGLRGPGVSSRAGEGGDR